MGNGIGKKRDAMLILVVRLVVEPPPSREKKAINREELIPGWTIAKTFQITNEVSASNHHRQVYNSDPNGL